MNIREELEKLKKVSKPIRTGEILSIEPERRFDVYRVPIKLLKPNPYNDRIASSARTFEKNESRKFDLDLEEDIIKIYDLIMEEHVRENLETLKDIKKNKQRKVAVISNEGIIVDGNRRATIIRELYNNYIKHDVNQEEFRFLEAIILEDDYTAKEIMKLETEIQLGEDEKVDYNPINIYLKIDKLLNEGYSEKEIATMMKKKEKEIKDKKIIFGHMTSYLISIGSENDFSKLDKLEDHFITFSTFHRKVTNQSSITNWSPSKTKISKMRNIAYDYITSKYEGKEFRNLFGSSKINPGIFYDEEIFTEFETRHETIKKDNISGDSSYWFNPEIKKQLKNNLMRSKRKIDDNKLEKKPSYLIDEISGKISKLESLLKEHREEITTEEYDSIKQSQKKLYKIIVEWKKCL